MSLHEHKSCPRCGLPRFLGETEYIGPQCMCGISMVLPSAAQTDQSDRVAALEDALRVAREALNRAYYTKIEDHTVFTYDQMYQALSRIQEVLK